jgi:hypothetical protein
VSSFTDDLRVQVEQGEQDGRGLVLLLAPFSYHVGSYPSDDVIVVPAGFVTDFASVPWFGRWLFSPFDRGAKAAVVHDWLIEQAIRSRRDADVIFREALGVLGVAPWRAWIMWAAVRLRALTT